MKGFETIAVSALRGGREVLRQVSVGLRVGELVGVLGPNGAGKSSLLGVLAGELPASAGEVRIDGQALATRDAQAQARARAVLPQHPALAFNLSVTEVIAMGAYPFPEIAPHQIADWIRRSLEDAGLQHLSSARYDALSGGQAQRVQFARVLVQARAAAATQGHAILFLDEPTSSLDPQFQIQLMRCLRRLCKAEQFGILVILHDVNLAADWCSRIVLLKAGRVVCDGPPRQALKPEALTGVFGFPMRVVPHPLAPDRILVLASGDDVSTGVDV